MKRFVIRLLLVLILLGLIFGGIFGWKYFQFQQMAAQMNQPPPPAVVSGTEVRRETRQPTRNAVGSLTAVDTVRVSSEVAGIVERIQFESGDRVNRGSVLIRLEASVDEAALEGLKADRQLAKVQFERSKDLLPKGGVSQSEFDEAKARYDAARADVVEQQARIAKKTIRSPFAGALGLRRVSVGQYLDPGDAIVDLQAIQPIYVDYTLPEQYLPELSEGQVVHIEVAAYPDIRFSGTLTAIDPGVEEGTRSVSLRATFENPEGRLKPGMFAQVFTEIDEERSVLTIPRTAVSFNTYGDYVYRIVSGAGDGLKVERQQIQTGAVQDGRVEVVKGLKADERIVEAGLVKLREGQAVTLKDDVELRHGEVSGE
jgi:membrane fusion protein (multidrug efflux system)